MILDDVVYLQSEEAASWLSALAADILTSENHLAWAMRLRERVGLQRARSLLETATLRQRAAVKFGRAQEMLFTRVALEQATAETVSRYRASVFQASGLDRILELGAGIGGDSLSLAAVSSLIGVEKDPVRLAMAVHNVAVYGHHERFQPRQGDALLLEPERLADWLDPGSTGLYFDPSRRDQLGRRLRRLVEYKPPVMAVVDSWRARLAGICVKISPGVDYAELPPEAEIEFVSLAGEVREGVLWFGALRRGSARRATLLPDAVSLTTADLPDGVPVKAPGKYLYEPDGAIIRAHLVEAVAGLLGAAKIDPDIAYLTSDALHQTRLARCFVLEADMPFQLKRLRRYLRERHVGSVTIKKRGSPLDVETLRSQLRLEGTEQRTLFLTRVSGAPRVLVGLPDPEAAVRAPGDEVTPAP